jgi:predicted Co/Zn/Cd cation transporter (cation efflux family)
MIQRIQSIFLFLAGGASLGLFGLPFATTPKAIESSMIFGDALYNVNDQMGLSVLFGLAGVLAIIAIFLFRNRGLQSKVSLSALILNIGGLVFAIYYLTQNLTEAGRAAIEFAFGGAFPLLSILFCFLAYRFIRKDDKLVKSMDRLR